jgi:tetratricopeptide (TPR) repeat protein
VGDPKDLIEFIDNALKNDPNNVDLWFGRGRVYYKLQDYDETIASFQKVVELKPDLYDGNYYLGLFYTLKADVLNKEVNGRSFYSQSEYDAALKDVNDVYMAAIPYFEKAHELKPDDVDTVDYLKSLCFRLRDEEGMMDKYNQYNTLLKQLKGIE